MTVVNGGGLDARPTTLVCPLCVRTVGEPHACERDGAVRLREVVYVDTIVPGERDDFGDFLLWLHRDRAFDAVEIIRVIEKPHAYRDEYLGYLRLGGVDRGA